MRTQKSKKNTLPDIPDFLASIGKPQADGGPSFLEFPQSSWALQAARTPSEKVSKKQPFPSATGLPRDIQAVEDMSTALDLSGLKLKNFGSNKDAIVLEIKVSEGTLDAASNGKVEVAGTGTGTLQFIGRRTDILKLFKDKTAISYTGAKDDFGTDAAILTISAVSSGMTFTLGSAGIDIADVSDDQIGTPQDDTLTGDDGKNTLIGLAGNDYLQGLAGDDSIEGNAGDDTVRGGEGADTLDGGDGEDVLQYTGSSAGVTVDLRADGSGAQNVSGGDAEGDVVRNFEHVYSSEFDDVVTGTDERNILFGYGGNDVLIGLGGDDVIRGGEGADTMDGGDGSDWLRYQGSAEGVRIDLNIDLNGFQKASGGEAEGDVISSFENVQGSDGGDTITGNADANYLMGYAGADSIDGGGGNDTIRGGEGADTLEGGDGADVLQYTDSASGVLVNLLADVSGLQQASGGDAEGDVISGFEHIYASNSDDHLTGNAARNIIYGYAGNDTINGGDGNDVLRGGAGADEFVFNTALGPGNVDRITDFESGLDIIVLDNDIFTSLSEGALDPTNFHLNDTGLAGSSDHHIIYESDTGKLYYDIDGNGPDEGIVFANLSPLPMLDAADFFVL